MTLSGPGKGTALWLLGEDPENTFRRHLSPSHRSGSGSVPGDLETGSLGERRLTTVTGYEIPRIDQHRRGDVQDVQGAYPQGGCMLSREDLATRVDVHQVVVGELPDAGLDVVLEVTQRASYSGEVELPPKDLEMPGGRKLDAMQMREHRRRSEPSANAQRRRAVRLRQVPLGDDAGVEVSAQNRSSRISRMIRLAGVPVAARGPRRFMRAAESGQVIVPFALRAGTRRATTVPRFVIAIS